MQRPGDQICIDNRPTGSTQLFKIKARLNIQTVSKLKDLIITDEAYCDEPAPVPVKQDDLLHLVFLVDTSDSFNKLDNSSSAAGNVVLEKWIMPLLKKGKYNNRTAPTTVTVIQFSGMGPDKNYVPGSKGVAVKGATLFHYKVEMGPVNFQNMGDIQMNKEVNKLDDIDTIDGNGQLYLALQDISMANFTDALNQAAGLSAGAACKRFLVVITDDEWDMNDLKICQEITSKGIAPVDANAKKREIIKFAKSKYAEIHVCCVRDAVTADMDEFVNLMATGAAGTGNIHQIPRTDVINLSRGGRAVQMDKAMTGLKKSLASFNLNF